MTLDAPGDPIDMAARTTPSRSGKGTASLEHEPGQAGELGASVRVREHRCLRGSPARRFTTRMGRYRASAAWLSG